MVTIKDIARKASVSPATVSRVINSRGWVSEEKEKRILAAINELDYKPSQAARSLRTGVRNLLGVLISNPFGSLYDDIYFTHVIRGFGHIAENQGFSLILSNLTGGELPPIIASKVVDGVVIGGHIVNTRLIERLLDLGIKIVILGKHGSSLDVPRVTQDNYTGMYNGVKHLISQGHKDIGIVVGTMEFYANQDKFSGYKDALKDAGIAFRDEYAIIQPKGVSSNHGYNGFNTLLNRENQPSAVVAADGSILYGVYQAYLELNSAHSVNTEILGWEETGDSLFRFNFPRICVDAVRVGEMLGEVLVNLVSNKEFSRYQNIIPCVQTKSLRERSDSV